MFRIGHGFDAHRFCDGSGFKIGGVEVPYTKGLEGHSDADVLIHAICDACLGSVGESDIGTFFPDSDPDYKDISSLKLLAEVSNILKEKSFEIINIDSVVICQKPTLAPYIGSMKEAISAAVKLPKSEIGIKATTTETMGFTGREEGIAATAIVLVKKI